MSPRLLTVADFVPQGSVTADIGTDHGYLPAYLLLHGRSPEVYASDLRSGPLSAARKTAEEWELGGKIHFVLADGLQGIAPMSVTAITIAGMGGETIADILEAAPWVHSEHVTLILQPQSKTEILVKWLDNNGFAIRDIRLVRDMGRIYVVMQVQAGRGRAHEFYAERVADRLLFEKRDPLLPDYLERLIQSVKKRLDGLESSSEPDENEISMQRDSLHTLLAMRAETAKWQPVAK